MPLLKSLNLLLKECYHEPYYRSVVFSSSVANCFWAVVIFCFFYFKGMVMTKNEALQMALEMIEFNTHERRHVRWAIKEALCEQPSIAQSIRDAAVNWPQNIGGVEHGILDSFLDWSVPRWWVIINKSTDIEEKYQARTFMLLVAEALE